MLDNRLNNSETRQKQADPEQYISLEVMLRVWRVLSLHFQDAALFLHIWGKGLGPFKRGKFPKLGKKSHNEQKIDNVLE